MHGVRWYGFGFGVSESFGKFKSIPIPIYEQSSLVNKISMKREREMNCEGRYIQL